MANNRRNTTITVLISLFLLTGTVLYAQTPIWPDSPADKRIQFIQSININEFENPPSKSLFHKLKNFFFAELLPPLIKPMGLDIDGNILAVADAATAGIHLYDLKNNSRLFLTYRIKNSLQSPIDAVIIDKEIYVIYSTCRNIAIFNLEGEIVKTLPLHSEKSRYTGISEYNNRLFLVNTAEHHILSLNLEGEDPIILGRRGKGADEMNYPTFLTHDSKGNIYISDSMNFRLLRWNILDNIKKIIGKRGMMSGQLNRPKGIAVYKDIVLVIDASFNNIQLYNTEGDFLMHFGSFGTSNWCFNSPTDICVENDLLYVSDTDNKRIQVFRICDEK